EGRGDQIPPITDAADSLFKSPVVIAVPQPVYQSLGWSTQVGWSQLVSLAQNGSGLDFKLGQTNPSYSSSGLAAAVGAFYAFTGHVARDRHVLNAGDVAAPAAQRQMRSLEKAVVHNGEQTLKLLAGLRKAIDSTKDGSSVQKYLSAVTVEEASMVAFN